MILARCDINTCRKEFEPLTLHHARILDSEYDLCPSCYKSLTSWIKERLTGGRRISDDIPGILLEDGQSVMVGGMSSGTSTVSWPSTNKQQITYK